MGEADISGIDELVYNPATGPRGTIGYGYDRGKKVQGIKWSNHDNHLHIGFTNREVAMEVIDKADSMGLKTTENPYAKRDPNGKVDKVHTKNSFHYKLFPGEPKVGAAVDISGDSDKITELIKWIDNKYAGTSFKEDPTIDTDDNFNTSGLGTAGLAATGLAAGKVAATGSGGWEFGKIMGGLSEMLNNKNDFKKFLFEASSNSNQIFGGNSFKWGGGPSDHGSRPLGNWQSDNAWDVMAPKGTPVYAIEGGKVVGLGGSPQLKKGVIYGYQVTIQSNDNSFFYTHLGERAPGIEMGAEVKKGDVIGFIGAPNDKWPQHVHIGLKKGDISKYMDKTGNLVGHTGGSTGEVVSNQTDSTKPVNTSNITSNLSDLLKASKNSSGEVPRDTVLMSAMSGLGKIFGLKESFGKNVQERYGYITIPAKSNEKILSPIDGVVETGTFSRSCKNQLIVKLEDKKGLLKFCNITDLKVKNKQRISKGTLLGKTSDDVEVGYFDESFERKTLKDNTFDGYKPKKKETKIDYKQKTEREPEYIDPALAAIPTFISSIFKNKRDDETGEVEKRWGYATDKDGVDPWIVKGISKPFEKLGKFLGTNKKVDESKINENIQKIKRLLK